jgi:hypothetical protein
MRSTVYETAGRRLLLLIPIGGTLILLGVLLRGPSLDPGADPAAYARAISAALAPTGWLAIFLGMVVLLPGLLGVPLGLQDDAQGRRAVWGAALSVLGIALVLPLIGFSALAAPVEGRRFLEGEAAALDAARAMSGSALALALAITSGLAYTTGSALLALALLKAGRLPGILALCYGLQAPLLAFVALVSLPAEVAGAALLLVSTLFLNWSVRRQAHKRRSERSVRT